MTAKSVSLFVGLFVLSSTGNVAFGEDNQSKKATKVIEKIYKCQGMIKSYGQKFKVYDDGTYQGEDFLTFEDEGHRRSEISGIYKEMFAMGLRPTAVITEQTNSKDGAAIGVRKNTILKGSLSPLHSLKKGDNTKLVFERSHKSKLTGKTKAVKYTYDIQIMDEHKAFSEVFGLTDVVAIRSKRRLIDHKHPDPKIKEDNCETTGVYSPKYGWIKYTMVDFVNDSIVADETCVLSKYKEEKLI